MNSEYINRITAGYVNQLSRVNRLEEKTRQLFPVYKMNETDAYLETINKRREARKILNRWFNLFNAVSKRIANN